MRHILWRSVLGLAIVLSIVGVVAYVPTHGQEEEYIWCTATPVEIGYYGTDVDIWPPSVDVKYEMYFARETNLEYVPYTLYFLGEAVGPEIASLNGFDAEREQLKFGIDTDWVWRHRGDYHVLSNWYVKYACGTRETSTPTPVLETPPHTPTPASMHGIEVEYISPIQVAPGEEFTPAVTIRVTSGSIGFEGDHLHAVPESNDNTFGAWPVQPMRHVVSSGQTYTFDVNNDTGFTMQAPLGEGAYFSKWRLRIGGEYIGPEIVIPITVGSSPVPADTMAPETSVLAGPASCGNQSSVIFQFGGSDNATDENSLRFSHQVDGGNWTSFSSNATVTIGELADGAHVVRVKAQDLAGNEDSSPVEYNFQIDTVEPSTSAELLGLSGNNGWFRSPVDLLLSAADSGCGSERMTTQFNIDGTGWTTYQGAIDFDEEGRSLVEYRSIDGAGNVEVTQTEAVDIDWTAPNSIGLATGPRDVNGVFRDAIAISFEVTDNLSGPEHTEYSSDSGASWTELSLAQNSFIVDGNGVTMFLYRSEDVAGNLELAKESGPIVVNKFVVFSARNDCSLQILDTTSLTVVGDLHSNGCAVVSRNTGMIVDGSIEVVGQGSEVTDNTNSLVPLSPGEYSELLSYILSFYRERANVLFPSDLYIDSVDKSLSGIVYVEGDLYLSAVSFAGDVTFVVEGNIVDNTTAGAFVNHDIHNGIVVFSGGDLELAGTGIISLGLFYAPNGVIRVTGTNLDFHGSLAAQSVVIQRATGLSLEYDPGFADSTHELPLASMVLAPYATDLPPLPSVPTIVSPDEGEVVVLPKNLSWVGSTSDVGYNVEVSVSRSFEPETLVANVSHLDSYHRLGLLPEGDYFYRVRAVNQAGVSAWSPVESFRVQSVVPTPTAETTPTPLPTMTPTSEPTHTPLPDLFVTSATLSEANPLPGRYFSLRTCVKNGGLETAGMTRLGIYYDDYTQPDYSSPADDYSLVGSILSGREYCVTSWLRFSDAGTHSVHVLADYLQEETESNELNNSFGPIQIPVGEVQSTPAATPTPLLVPTVAPTGTPEPTAQPTDSPAATATVIPGGSDELRFLYVSFSSGGEVPGVEYEDEDVLRYDLQSGEWSMFLDMSEFISYGDVNGIAVNNDGTVDLTFDGSVSLPDVGSVRYEDVVRFTPGSPGNYSSGQFELIMDGSQRQLKYEDIDALAAFNGGGYALSLSSSFDTDTVSGKDEDVIFTGSGDWSMLFDGSDVDVTDDVVGLWIDNLTGEIFMVIDDFYQLGGVSGDEMDIIVCDPTSVGEDTVCAFSHFWDGSAHGTEDDIDGISLSSN